MSYENFVKGIELAKRCDYYTTIGGKTDDIILKAGQLFGRKFSKQNYEFFKRLGYLSFDGNEFYGICKDDFTGSYTGCAIEAALSDRKDYDLPKEWIPIYFFDDGYYGYLDYSQINEDGEPPVIMAMYNGKEYVVVEKVAEDFGDFILDKVEEQMADQQI